MTPKERARQQISSLVNKPVVLFTSRGNTAIESALEWVQLQGRSTLLIPDQGGWMTYEKTALSLGFTVIRLKTEYGIILPEMVVGDDTTAVLLNSMPAYAFNLDMPALAQRCSEQNIILINDVTASIGTSDACVGDVILGSFGRWKPLPLGAGGFLALETPLHTQEPELDYENLSALLTSLPQRREAMLTRVQKLKSRIPHCVFPDHVGYNLICLYSDELEKENLIKIAHENASEVTLCPREIRILHDAVCFEVKRNF